MVLVTWKTQPGESDGLTHKKRVTPQSLYWQMRTQPHLWSPPTDLFETANAFIVRVEVAGMREQDFSVTFENGYLTIRGTRPDDALPRAYYQMEVRFGEFSSVVALPGPVNLEQANAEYEDGFLTVTMPRR